MQHNKENVKRRSLIMLWNIWDTKHKHVKKGRPLSIVDIEPPDMNSLEHLAGAQQQPMGLVLFSTGQKIDSKLSSPIPTVVIPSNTTPANNPPPCGPPPPPPPPLPSSKHTQTFLAHSACKPVASDQDIKLRPLTLTDELKRKMEAQRSRSADDIRHSFQLLEAKYHQGNSNHQPEENSLEGVMKLALKKYNRQYSSVEVMDVCDDKDQDFSTM